MNKLWQKNGLIWSGMVFLILFMFWSSPQAQVMQTLKFEAGDGDMFMLPEVGGIVVESDDGPQLQMVLPDNHRAKDYKTLDLQVGDIIKMFNGKSMKTVSSLQETYDALKIGDEVKFGIRRDKAIMMVKFSKMDPNDSPAKMSIMKTDGTGVGEMGNMIPEFVELGLIVDNKNGIMNVMDVITEVESVFTGIQPENDDKIIKIQSQKIKSPEQLSQIYAKIKAGEKASMTILRKGEEVVLNFIKPEANKSPLKVMKKQGK